MYTYPKLNKDPIKEALINIELDIHENKTPDKLLIIEKFINDTYKYRKSLTSVMGDIKLENSSIKESSIKSEKKGYAYRTEDKKQVVQLRSNSFTFNRLKPYTGWEVFFDETKRLWNYYKDIVKPKRIKQVSLRYINSFEIPVNKVISDYIKTYPIIFQTYPNIKSKPGIAGTFTQILLVHPSSNNVLAKLIEKIEVSKSNKNNLHIIMDIEVVNNFEQNETSLLNDDEFFHKIVRLREFKNEIFFGNITEKVKEEIFI